MNIPPADPWLLSRLVCPRDRGRLTLENAASLACASGHRYPIVDGVPVMLVQDVAPTLDQATRALTGNYADRADTPAAHLHLDTIAISDDEKAGVLELLATGSAIDPVVAYLVAATNGLMYRDLVGTLSTYPIPESPLPPGNGLVLDIGCSWGRWSVAASRRGYDVVGLDPSLGAIMAARRVSAQLGAAAHFVVGDARFLPFADGFFDRVFSYSVLQHFGKTDLALAVADVGRVLRDGGHSHVQMAARYGVRCLYHQARRGFSGGEGFDVRYWSVSELRKLFADRIGETTLTVDCYFGIGLQPSDAPLMSPLRRTVLRASSLVKRAQRLAPFLIQVADSVYVNSTRTAAA